MEEEKKDLISREIGKFRDQMKVRVAPPRLRRRRVQCPSSVCRAAVLGGDPLSPRRAQEVLCSLCVCGGRGPAVKIVLLAVW